MESKISEANSHDEIIMSIGDLLIMTIPYTLILNNYFNKKTE
ncbi:MAG TPA: hypothetical protein VGK38_00365 [Prolixibacteraceae bacterium]